MERRPCPPPLPQDAGAEERAACEEPALYRRPMTDHEWQSVSTLLRNCVSQLNGDKITFLKTHISERIRWLDDFMTCYCDLTCPSCQDPCCGGLEVFYNRTDILYLSALDGEIPTGQTRPLASEPCRYLAPEGCTIPRVLRPYVCVWFLCDAQMNLLRDEHPVFQRHFVRILGEIRTLRLRLESLYQLRFGGCDDLSLLLGQ